ncbi:MAG: hypothetical protein DMD50_11235 [Gemmatimonadetes bacterium]|nr:MAG: hypothetical protein DMD50_11235 [Gemmatimonadota bacterium]
MQQTGAGDGEERRRHEDLVGRRVEDGAGARPAEPACQHPVEKIRRSGRAHQCELPRRLVHERKRCGQRKPKRRQEIGPGYPRFHLPLPPVRHTFVRVNLNLLKQAAIFQDLDDGELARVSEVCREQKFAVSQQVFKEGEPGNRLFIISEGEVRISRTIPGSGEEALAVLKPGACFGEMAIFDRSERSTDAIANTSCTLLTIARSDFELLLDFNRDIAYKVLWSVVRLLSARLRVTNDNLRSFLAMSMF